MKNMLTTPAVRVVCRNAREFPPFLRIRSAVHGASIPAGLPRRAVAGVLILAVNALLAGCAGGGAPHPPGTGTAVAPVAPVARAEASPSQTYAVRIPPGQVDAAVARLDALAAELMRRSNIPGMAVAVVHDGRVVYAKGFGVRRVGSPEPVDADTVFQLASLSKPIAATVVAAAVGRGGVAWDTPVASRLPGFRLSDDWVTQHVTIGDFFAHRSGLGNHAGDQLEDLGYDRRQVLQRLRYAPLQPFRITYTYTNFGITAGAEAAAAGTGFDWESLSERTLYQPLGMHSTSSRFSDFMQRSDRASPHVLLDGRYQPLHQRQPDAQTAAGGVSSSVDDLARWMTMVLQDGSFEGRQVIEAQALLPAISARIVSAPSDTPAARAGFYGYGFNVGTTPSGRVRLSHSGAFLLGAGTAVSMIPAAGVGIVTLTNAAPVGAAEALNATFEDLVESGAPKRDWYAAYSQRMAGLYAPEGSLVGQSPPDRPRPALADEAYVGDYDNSYYGRAVVQASGGALVLKMGPQRAKTFALRHWDGNTFVFDLAGENAATGSLSRVDFEPDASGESTRLRIEYFAEDLAHGLFQRSR